LQPLFVCCVNTAQFNIKKNYILVSLVFVFSRNKRESLQTLSACWFTNYPAIRHVVQGDSVTRGSKLLSIKNYVIEIMTWKFIYTYRERYKTGPAQNRCWNWSPFTSKHTWMRFSKFFEYFSQICLGPVARESPCIWSHRRLHRVTQQNVLILVIFVDRTF